MKMFGIYKTTSTIAVLMFISSCIGGASDEFDINNAFSKENLVDVLICGSGPAGLCAAIHGARSRLNTLVIEGNSPGGQLMRTTWVENFPGIEKIMGPELIAKIRKQASNFGAEFLSDAVKAIDLSSWPYKVTTENGLQLHAMSIIVATGVFPRSLGIPGEQEYFGKGVSHCAICDGPFYKGEDVIVVGGGDSAVEEAMQLAPYAKKITVLVRGTKMRAVPIMRERLEGYDNIEVKYNTALKEILGDGNQVTGATLLDKVSRKVYHMPISGVFLAVGSTPNTLFLKGNVEMDSRGFLILKGRTQKTSKKGVYAAGDVEADRGHQAIIASGSGVQACIDAYKFLTEEIGLNTKVVSKLSNNYFRKMSFDKTSEKKEEDKSQDKQETKN